MFEDNISLASMGYSFGRMFDDYRCYGDFRVAEWVEHENPLEVIRLGYETEEK